MARLPPRERQGAFGNTRARGRRLARIPPSRSFSRRCSAVPQRTLRGAAPLLRLTALHGPKGRDWGKARADETRKVLADPTVLARRFTESVGIVESTSRNYQAFHPSGHTFGGSAD